MRRDPLGRVPTAVRLWSAAGFCAVSLGLEWTYQPGSSTPGTTLYGDCGHSDATFCTPDTYLSGTYAPGQAVLGSQTPARVFLVLAMVGFVLAAPARTRVTRRLARVASVSVGIATVLALASRSALVLVCLLSALVLAVPLLWPRTLAPEHSRG